MSLDNTGFVNSTTAVPRRVLCVWFPDWPIQRIVVAQPELRRQYVILFWHHPQRGQLVAAASPRAQQAGVCRDMPLSEARALLKIQTPAQSGFARPRNVVTHQSPRTQQSSLPQVTLHQLPYQPELDRVALQELALQSQIFSPLVALERALHPSSMLLEIGGLGHLFGGEHALLEQVRSHFESRGYYPRIGIGETVGAAWADARFPGYPLSELPHEALRLPTATLETLEQLGIQRVGQLLQLPRKAIQVRLGKEVGERLDELTGERVELLDMLYSPPEQTVQQFLEYPVSHLVTLEVVVERLVTQLCRQLAEMRRGALQWCVVLSAAEQPAVRVMIDVYQPTANPKHVMELYKMRLEHLLTQQFSDSKRGSQPVAVQEVTVSVQRSMLVHDRQRHLFDEPARPNHAALAQLINRLASHLGSQHVLRPRLVASAQAEYAMRLVPWVGPAADSERTAKPQQQIAQVARTLKRTTYQNKNDATRRWKKQPAEESLANISPANQGPCPAPFSRPLRLYSQPIKLQTIVGPSNSPELLIHEKSRLRVMRAWGPERIETGWWRGPSVRRDYWRVELEAGCWWWIYYDLCQSSWFLHGEF
ncbi:MAG TPA: DNA polymerase Y family protein [Pirellulaceae bacterium]|nr:DNA polymerase Y family protein [Pirellulaceae bacterium]HMO93314.1 DNA polymerase Y family protein [Pirellulaceae bacterium]HMP69147.1 DNA polymerase Y family protein [Pirellulaceae bacterium]